jgi:lipoic acid synthetase
MADFQRSLDVLRRAKKMNPAILTKSGFMVGLGESQQEVFSLMKELRKADVDIITIGQYIAPSRNHYSVVEYVHPDIFKNYREEGEKMGFKIVESAPLVRSSFHAEKARKFIKKSLS